MKTLFALITLALLLTSCGDYKAGDAGVKKIQAEYSLDSLDREIQARW